VLRLNPGHAPALSTYANLLWELSGDAEGAEVLLRRAVDSDPRCAPALASYARLLRDVHGDADRARAMLARAEEAGRGDPIVQLVRQEPEWADLARGRGASAGGDARQTPARGGGVGVRAGGGRYTFSRAADGPGLKGKNGSNVREDGGAGDRRDVARSGRRKVYPLERPPAREEMEVADLGPQGGRDDGAEPRGGDSSTCEPLGCL
jgi:hypothetical protein